MDLLLGNLIGLKRRLLAGTMLAQTTYDTTITQIGRGVAQLLDKHCNREFGRSAGAVDYFSADRTTWITRRFPIETITSIEQRDTVDGGWTTLTANDVIINRDDQAGLIQFGAVQGSYLSQMRVTYTGGYWYDTSESDDSTMPATATALPHDVREAWYLQCESVWQVRDKLGTNLLKAGGGDAALVSLSLPGLDLIPIVKQMLQRHIRMQMT